MARLEFRGKTIAAPGLAAVDTIRLTLAEYGIAYERWAVRLDAAAAPDDLVLAIYQPEVDRLKRERGYVTADLVALEPSTPNLDALLAKFDREHHHTDDEVRFTVAGAGVFEVESRPGSGDFLKFTAEPGDLLVIPASRRHRFYLTDQRTIRTIRLFKSKDGWEAIYVKPAN